MPICKSSTKSNSKNNVSIGYSWINTGQQEKLSVWGRSYFIEPPALSGLSIGNYPYSSLFNLTSIIPQWNSSTLLGLPTERFLEAHVTYIYYVNMFNISDKNLKTNIKPINGEIALNAIKRINAYSYDYKPEIFKNSPKEMEGMLTEQGKNQIGLMAQEIREIFPQLVKSDEKTEQLSVNYVALIPILIESIKEQQKQIEQLKLMIIQLEQK